MEVWEFPCPKEVSSSLGIFLSAECPPPASAAVFGGFYKPGCLWQINPVKFTYARSNAPAGDFLDKGR
jgi:hypothetical protein